MLLPFCSRCATSQDGRRQSCHKRVDTVLIEPIPYMIAMDLDLRLEEDTIFTFQTLRHLVRLRIQTLVTLTVHQQAMLTQVLSLEHSLPALTNSAQLKWKSSISLRRNVRELCNISTLSKTKFIMKDKRYV